MTLRKNHLLYVLFCLVFSGINLLHAQYIQVDTQTYTPEQLVKDIFFGGGSSGCITVDNIKITGWDFGNGNKSWGYFSKASSSFEMDAGIILSTGSATTAPGPNSNIQTEDSKKPFFSSEWKGDDDLENALQIGNTSHNATVLEFDFTASVSAKISFQYMFLSEQYLMNPRSGNGWDQCDFTDGFAFLIRKEDGASQYQNIALVPNTTLPVSVQNIRGSGTRCQPANEEYFARFNGVESPTNFNGQTVILEAATKIIPGQKYHLKLVIADQGNGFYDSAVFLKAGSFMGNKDLGPDFTIANATALCEGELKVLDATTPEATSYQWYHNGKEIPFATQATYTVSEAGFYEVLIMSAGCHSKGSITIDYTEKPQVDSTKLYSECDHELSGRIKKNLHTVAYEIIKNPQNYFNTLFYENKSDAEAGNTATIPDPEQWEFSKDTTVYVRVESGNCQAVTVPVRFNYNSSQKSTLLQDKTICSNEVGRLQVEPNIYSNVIWFKNKQQIGTGEILENVSPGEFTARLFKNNCSYDQNVVVSAAENPVITAIDVKGSTVTVTVSGGTRPYQYSIDDPNNVTIKSNIFEQVARGRHTIFVKDAVGCTIMEKPFIIINLINVITPNGDGYNDVLDYSDLHIKKDVSLQIFDRYGNEIFQSKTNEYLWNGTNNGRPVPTGTYWYILKWTEPDTGLPISYSNWILVKNRN